MLSILGNKRTSSSASLDPEVSDQLPGKVAAAEKSAEPISTATIAEIYIRQGFPEKALKVYRDLLRADPQNDQLRQKLIALKARLTGVNAEAAVPEMIPEAATVMPDSSSVDGRPAAIVAGPVAIGPDSTEEFAGRPMLEIFVDWLESISRRREAHVQ
jgi:hypothetical protein